ncbi:MAG: tol-pal system-associated acyl-CoA thioesterase [Rhodobacteraceae bacterium]|nr:tol-pal system-associated acyl-CoA thioesterase [Paracoccaceae bacterium]
MIHELKLRVFYEDTDMAGIVYYANYLKYIERARSTMVREAGISQGQMKEGDGQVFAVYKVEATYQRPAKLDDELTIATKVQHLSAAKMLFLQDVLRGQEVLFTSKVTVICMTTAGRPVRLPAEFRAKMQKFEA